MASRKDVEELLAAQKGAERLALRDLKRFWALLDLADPVACRQALLEFVPLLVSAYGDIAAAAAADWYEKMRAEHEGLPSFQTLLADPLPEAAVQQTVRRHAGGLWEENPQLVHQAIAQEVGRWVTDAAKQTVAKNVDSDPTKPRWARVPRGAKTCAWCSMMASRGWVYKEKATAAAASHRACDCQIVPSFGKKLPKIKGYDPEALYEECKVARAQVGAEGGDINDPRQISAAMRRLFPDKYTDGTGNTAAKIAPTPKKPNESKQGEKAERKQKSKPRTPEVVKGEVKTVRSKAVVFKEFASDEEGLQWARTKFPPVTAGEDPTRAVFEYTSKAYRPWNTALREAKGKVPRAWAPQTRALDALMDKHRIPEPVVLHRGAESWEFTFNGEQVPFGATVKQLKMLEGSIQTQHQYTSTSVGPKAVFDHKPVQIHFSVPQGSRAVNPMRIGKYGEDEREIILHRGLKYRIDLVQNDEMVDQIHVFATILEEME